MAEEQKKYITSKSSAFTMHSYHWLSPAIKQARGFNKRARVGKFCMGSEARWSATDTKKKPATIYRVGQT